MKGVGPYCPLFAVTAGDILVWQTEVVVWLVTAATFSCTDELVICNELSKAIKSSWRDRNPDAVAVCCCGSTVRANTDTGIVQGRFGYLRKRGAAIPTQEHSC